MSIVIRPAVAADTARWVDLRAALWPEQARAELAASAERFFVAQVRLLEAVLLAVDEQQEPVGFAELSRREYAEGCDTSPVAFLEGWYVVPGRRGQGVGRALVAAAEAWGRSRGCTEFASDATYDNTASAAAHQALGFEEVERLRCFRKPLTSASDGEPR